MSEGLVSRLLTRLHLVEELAQDAIQRRWLPADNLVEDENGAEVATFCVAADAGLAAHVADPQAVLRLCRAHRDIIDMYVQAKAQPVAESVPHSKERGLDHASAMGRLTALGLVLQTLAEGYGLNEEATTRD